MDILGIKTFLGRSNMFDKLKSIFSLGKKSDVIAEKDQATAKGEPFVKVLSTQFDPENPADGYFELEWNNIFVRKLLDAGYSGSTEEEIVDAWFTALCRQIAEEVK